MVDCIWNTRVIKHNLMGLVKNKLNMIVRGIELNCVSDWHFAPLRKKG